jgi:hypothetical protein
MRPDNGDAGGTQAWQGRLDYEVTTVGWVRVGSKLKLSAMAFTARTGATIPPRNSFYAPLRSAYAKATVTLSVPLIHSGNLAPVSMCAQSRRRGYEQLDAPFLVAKPPSSVLISSISCSHVLYNPQSLVYHFASQCLPSIFTKNKAHGARTSGDELQENLLMVEAPIKFGIVPDRRTGFHSYEP